MSADTPPSGPTADDGPLLLRRLLPAGEPASAEALLAGFAPADGPGAAGEKPVSAGMPYVLLNMVATADGRATLGGRSGPIGNRADREHFHALRAIVDGVMVGATTARVERYGRIVGDPERRRLRLEAGRSAEPVACIVTASVSLPADLPLLAEPEAKVLILTGSRRSLASPSAADVQYVRAERDGALDLAAALRELRERFAIGVLLCEGGPHLNGALLSGGLVSELHLSLSAVLGGGDGGDPAGAPRIVAGTPFAKPVELELVEALEYDSQLLLRYLVRTSEPASVSRETISSSSLAS